MGSPISPIIASIYMEYLESKILSTVSFKPKVWQRYIDDNFIIWSHSYDTLEPFLSYLNSQYKDIQFTMEEEVDGQIAFLDM